MSKKLLFNFNREVIQNYTYVKYVGTIITATNTLEKPIKSAILKGSTKYRDIDTGELLENFEEGRNLELVSVKTPVLTTIGKNIIDGQFKPGAVKWNITTFPWFNDGDLGSSTRAYLDKPLNIISGKTYTVSCINSGYVFAVHGKNLGTTDKFDSGWKINVPYTFTATYGCYALYVRKSDDSAITTQDELEEMYNSIMVEEGAVATSYEPYKTNILTVNEDVTLRSNGDICDELNLLTGQLTQRIGEDGVVLSQEVVKTVDLSILDQNGNKVSSISSFNDTTHITASSETIPPIFEGYLATKEVE